MKAKGNKQDSKFEINLLDRCLECLQNLGMPPNVRYIASLVLSNLKSDQINSFLSKFITQMTFEEFATQSFMATQDIEKTEKYLSSLIDFVDKDKIFREFIIPKNNEVVQTKSWSPVQHLHALSCNPVLFSYA